MKECKDVLASIKTWLEEEITREETHLRDIGGPTGTRNSTASALGLARNSVRREVLDRIGRISSVMLENEIK